MHMALSPVPGPNARRSGQRRDRHRRLVAGLGVAAMVAWQASGQQEIQTLLVGGMQIFATILRPGSSPQGLKTPAAHGNR
jgi:hypothetical protein